MGNKQSGEWGRRPSKTKAPAVNQKPIQPQLTESAFVGSESASLGSSNSANKIASQGQPSKAAKKVNQALQRAKSALEPKPQFENFSKPVERSKSVPIYGHRRADINIGEDTLEEISQKQSSMIDESKLRQVLQESEIESFFKKCDAFVYGSQKLSGTPGQERPRTGVVPSHISVSCIKGLKGTNDSSPNQDNYSYCSYKGCEFFVLQDGHGPAGHFVSFRGVRTLAYFVTQSKHFPSNMEKAITEGYKNCHADLLALALELKFDIQVSGCACVLMVRNGKKIWVSNAGDSRIIVCNSSNGNVVLETRDHKPNDPKETARIEQSGSEVQMFYYDGQVQIARVFVKGADYPGLCMSRSLGDQCVKEHGVTTTPEISSLDIIPGETFVVLASDGVWEFVPSKLACSSLAKKLAAEGKDKCVARVVTEAKKRWKAQEGSYCDDITAMLVLF